MSRRAADLLFLGALVLVGFLFLQFVYRPALRGERALRSELTETRGAISRSEDFTRGLEDLERYLLEFEGALRAMNELVPARIDGDARMREISKVIQDCGLQANSIRPDPELPRGGVTVHPLTVKVSGTYPQLLRFVAQAEALPRHTRVTRLSIENDARPGTPLRVEIELTSFSISPGTSS